MWLSVLMNADFLEVKIEALGGGSFASAALQKVLQEHPELNNVHEAFFLKWAEKDTNFEDDVRETERFAFERIRENYGPH